MGHGLQQKTHIKDKRTTEAKALFLTCRNINDVLLITNPNFVNYALLVYHKELEIKETTVSVPSFLNMYLEFDTNGNLSTRLYYKRDDCKYAIINCLHMLILIS